MSKAKKESVAEILARKKAEKKAKAKPTPKTTKKTTKKKPVPKKAGVNAGKKGKKTTPNDAKNKETPETVNSDIENLKNPTIYLAFIDFIATPPHLREHDTQGEFAKHFGVDQGTLSDWKKRIGFRQDVKEARKDIISDKMVGNIITALYKRVLKDGNGTEAKIILQMSGELEETKVIKDERPVRELSPERKEQLVENIKKWKIKRKEEREEIKEEERDTGEEKE